MKLRLTESQYERLKSLVKENVENRFNREVAVHFNYNGLTYKGCEVDEISPVKTRISFYIDIEYRSWGVASLNIYGISGEPEIETEIHYYPQGEEDTVSEQIKLSLKWDNVETDELKGQGIVSVGDYLSIDLGQDENGGFGAARMSIEVYRL